MHKPLQIQTWLTGHRILSWKRVLQLGACSMWIRCVAMLGCTVGLRWNMGRRTGSTCSPTLQKGVNPVCFSFVTTTCLQSLQLVTLCNAASGSKTHNQNGHETIVTYVLQEKSDSLQLAGSMSFTATSMFAIRSDMSTLSQRCDNDVFSISFLFWALSSCPTLVPPWHWHLRSEQVLSFALTPAKPTAWRTGRNRNPTLQKNVNAVASALSPPFVCNQSNLSPCATLPAAPRLITDDKGGEKKFMVYETSLDLGCPQIITLPNLETNPCACMYYVFSFFIMNSISFISVYFARGPWPIQFSIHMLLDFCGRFMLPLLVHDYYKRSASVVQVSCGEHRTQTRKCHLGSKTTGLNMSSWMLNVWKTFVKSMVVDHTCNFCMNNVFFIWHEFVK